MYNNYFPVTYPQTPPISYPQYQQTQNGINWVQGIEGAKAYPVAPNANVMLMDSTGDVFYIKSADATGKPTISVYDYKERRVGKDTTTDKKDAQIVTMDELTEILKGYEKKVTEDE